MLDDVFWQVHTGLKREAPGDDACFRRALRAVQLPSKPRILDIGCGPGAQSLALAAATDGEIIAIDTHQEFLDRLDTAAMERGLGARIHTRKLSMMEMPFARASFDLIWSEGAIYFMGFRNGLRCCRALLQPRGYLALTEPCWLRPYDELPAGATAAWSEYPAIASIGEILENISKEEFEVVDHFVLPPDAWWNYYSPMEKRIEELHAANEGDRRIVRRLDELREEIEGYRKFGHCYSYLFAVMQPA